MTRVFYVDTAKAKNNKRYWKCSVVEEGKNVINFADDKSIESIEAEAYTILKTVFWLVKQKEQGKVIIFTDCLALINHPFFKNLVQEYKKSPNRPKKSIRRVELISQFKAIRFVNLARKISRQNWIELKLLWIRGKDNPADYYSRH